ncbi:MAG: dihydromonapterin reductase [Pseudomonadota bacterium]|nr:dihydromonapterin reductase [Pseudomonadota bacterium]
MTDPILITGGATRLGLALADYYLMVGQQVVITYRSPRPQVNQLTDRGALCIAADFSTDDGVYAAAHELRDKCPVLRSIVHNASSWFTDPGGRQKLDHLALMMRVHVGAPMVLTETLAPALLGSNNPSVIHVSDHVANRGSDQHMAYAASKSAMLNLTKSQAKKYAPEIRVNALCPALLEFRDDDEAAYRERAIAKSALKIVPGFDVAVEAICYLQSNRYTTGSILPLDGGRPLGMP